MSEFFCFLICIKGWSSKYFYLVQGSENLRLKLRLPSDLVTYATTWARIKVLQTYGKRFIFTARLQMALCQYRNFLVSTNITWIFYYLLKKVDFYIIVVSTVIVRFYYIICNSKSLFFLITKLLQYFWISGCVTPGITNSFICNNNIWK